MDDILSILKTIRKMSGIGVDDTQFDSDLIIAINSALMILKQMGIGPSSGFLITGIDEKWTDFLGDKTDLESVKLYVYFKTKLAFDPPSNSFLIESIKDQIRELEWRLNVEAENTTTVTEGGTVSG